jgi:uncharacterized membrane protein YfcA
MAFGVISTAAMLAIGLPPAQASAIVHSAEIFTTGASAASHIWHRNVDWRLESRLGVAGVIGATLGAWILSNVDATAIRPVIFGYLLLVGLFILWRAVVMAPMCGAPAAWTAPVGFIAGFLDAQRWRRLGAGGDIDAGWLGAFAAARRRLGQHHRVLRHCAGRHHLLPSSSAPRR